MGIIKLALLCQKQGLTQAALAEDLQVSSAAVGKWWRGESRPHAPVARKLAQRLGVSDPNELWLEEQLKPKSLEQEQAMDFLNKLDRRELFALLQTLPFFAGIDLSLLESPRVAPDAFLSQCNASIKGCWHLMNHYDHTIVESILKEYLPTLGNLATNPSEHQEVAASLATQAKILQILIATHRLDFTSRKLLCLEAVKFGELSGDSLTHTGALYWQGDTYVYLYHQPQRAIPIFEAALSRLNSDAQPHKSMIDANLSIAYAQLGDEQGAQGYAEQAMKGIPKQPTPNLYGCTMGTSALNRFEGRMFLALAEHLPNEGYAQRAYDAFGKSINTMSNGERYRCQTLIHKADAALLIGDMYEYATCLEDGMQLACRVGSPKRQQEATTVYEKAPQSWLAERRYKELAPLF
jgi:transcriptional regulator with XRE-family HTH domain